MSEKKKNLFELLTDKLWRKILNGHSEHDTKSTLKEYEFIGLFFHSHWCLPGRTFNSKLIDVIYDTIKKDTGREKEVEIIYISYDRTRQEFDDYFSQLPYLGLPYGDPKRDEIIGTFGILGIPSLLIFNRDGQLLKEDARDDILKLKEKCVDEWRKLSPIDK